LGQVLKAVGSIPTVADYGISLAGETGLTEPQGIYSPSSGFWGLTYILLGLGFAAGSFGSKALWEGHTVMRVYPIRRPSWPPISVNNSWRQVEI
jgi:hypothetical protein